MRTYGLTVSLMLTSMTSCSSHSVARARDRFLLARR